MFVLFSGGIFKIISPVASSTTSFISDIFESSSATFNGNINNFPLVNGIISHTCSSLEEYLIFRYLSP